MDRRKSGHSDGPEQVKKAAKLLGSDGHHQERFPPRRSEALALDTQGYPPHLQQLDRVLEKILEGRGVAREPQRGQEADVRHQARLEGREPR